MGVVYHAHYLVWFELGRTELMRAAGSAYRELEDDAGLSFPVIEAGARYHASARYDDLLTVHTRLTEVSGARIRFDYRVTRDGQEGALATGFTEHALVGREGRAQRLPGELRERLGRHLERAG